MENRLHRAADLTPKQKQAAETLLGRELREEEIVSVRSYTAHAIANTAERAELLKDLAELRQQMRSRIAPGVTAEELNQSLDAARAEVRRATAR